MQTNRSHLCYVTQPGACFYVIWWSWEEWDRLMETWLDWCCVLSYIPSTLVTHQPPLSLLFPLHDHIFTASFFFFHSSTVLSVSCGSFYCPPNIFHPLTCRSTHSESDACGWCATDTFHDVFLSQCWHICCCNQTTVHSLPILQAQSCIHKSAFIKTNQVHYQWISLRMTRCEAAAFALP